MGYRDVVIESGLLTACSRCGFDNTEVLEVHHRDRDRENSDPVNLEVLCPNCHKLEHKINRTQRRSGLKPARTMVALRVPDVLQALIDGAAEKSGISRSKWILEACRMQLDGGSSKRPEPEPVTGRNARKDTISGDGDASAASVTATGDSQPRPNMQALRDICDGSLPYNDPNYDPKADPDWNFLGPVKGTGEIPICGKTWWEDGEQYECLMDRAHKNPKHGMGGMVRKLND